jgi:hypothetical protein
MFGHSARSTFVGVIVGLKLTGTCAPREHTTQQSSSSN